MRRVDPPSAAIASTIAAPGPAPSHRVVQRHAGPAGNERTTASASALAAQENERQRIARELHDEIGQILTVALLMPQTCRRPCPADIRDELHDTQETVRAGLDEVRSIARRLRPDALEDLGLHSALNALCSEFARPAASSCQTPCDAASSRLRPDVELVCYRIAQESLTNVARHARRRRSGSTCTPPPISCTLRIADDGARQGRRTEGAGHQRHARTRAARRRRSHHLVAGQGRAPRCG